MSKKKGGKKKGKKVEKKEVLPLDHKHPGYSCLYLGDKELQTYGFKTGDGLLDVAPFQSLTKAAMLEEISFKGKMCAFHAFQSFIEGYPEEDVLFVWDMDEEKEKDCNFYFCHTLETRNVEQERLGIADGAMAMDAEEIARKKEEEEAEQRRLAAEAERIAEEQRIAAAIEELKKPLVARPWTDLGSYAEMMAERVEPSRALKAMTITRRRKFFAQKTQFSDQENVEGMNIEIRSLQTSLGYDVHRLLVDKAAQCGLPTLSQATQTKWNRKLNKIIQYEFNEESIRHKKSLATGKRTKSTSFSTQTGSRSFDYGELDMIGFDDDTKAEREAKAAMEARSSQDAYDAEEEDEKLLQFLEDVCPELEDMLTDNNLVNIYEDELAVFRRDADGVGLDIKTENIREIQTFVDLNWSRGKKISDIEWMPSSDGNIIAVSCVQNLGFDERVEIMNTSRVSTILLWNLSHILLRAQTILTAPTDVMVFRFHPSRRDVVVGGLENGQLLLWDLREYHDNAAKEKSKKSEHGHKGTKHGATTDDDSDADGDEDGMSDVEAPDGEDDDAKLEDEHDDEDPLIPQIAPQRLSHIERSHTKRVTDLRWLPPDVMVTPTGELKHIDIASRPSRCKHLAEEQFISIAGDGAVLFWSLAPPTQTEKERKKNEPAKWVPVFSRRLSKKLLGKDVCLGMLDKDTLDAVLDVIGEEDEVIDEKEAAEARFGVDIGDYYDGVDGGNAGAPSTEVLATKLCFTPLLGKVCVATELGELALLSVAKPGTELLSCRGSLLLQRYRDDKQLTTTSFLLDGAAAGSEVEAARETEIARSVLFARGRTVAEHFADVKNVAISPFFADIYATFGDWRFSIWRHNALIFSSPYCTSYIVCGCWSPSRPSVIITAKHDGTVDIWDLLDQTHCAVFKNSPVSSTAITALRFNERNPQQLAVADAAGNLRILQIPRNFTMPLSNERRQIAQFYRNEERKMRFVQKRRLQHRQRRSRRRYAGRSHSNHFGRVRE